MSDEKRPYRLKQRAEQQERTRLRITESAVELHGTLGVSRTSMSAVAERAGVRRSTLYRHFPDEAALLAACSAHWGAANPPPDLAAWAAVGEPGEGLAAALAELYAYYGRTRAMLEGLLRDEQTVPLVKEAFAGFRGYLAAAADTLAAGRPVGGPADRRVQAAVAHALAFPTWRSLVHENGLSDAEAVALMAGLVERAGAPG
jgi:AcrR family transcriptional regulator